MIYFKTVATSLLGEYVDDCCSSKERAATKRGNAAELLCISLHIVTSEYLPFNSPNNFT